MNELLGIEGGALQGVSWFFFKSYYVEPCSFLLRVPNAEFLYIRFDFLGLVFEKIKEKNPDFKGQRLVFLQERVENILGE